ncbi:AarF/ABC1/UbiB kinase family protein [Virgibacillus halodenitrificans]|uniref:ABC1 kinase family protein n=1 Tax=Virgibacillus halodenitrificans TaxID=1482 RepID=UPI001FB450AC|nr:AarF/ABC1/UbiB kinase family protein [Virgibacillus halodenitrificans]MCJ0930022.1 AarF/ABC1/UbiB kinase family protein [Virgibacillus halodenitrificans]
MLGKRIRHTKRYQEIINAFIRNGFSHVLFRIGLTERGAAKDTQSAANVNLQHVGRKLRNTLQELGPTFIKLGQIASSRHDALPEEIITELEKLQDHVQFFSFDKVQQIVEEELGDSINQLFQHVHEEPLATASIGQIHVGKLHNGEDVAIKVQRPDIEDRMETDLEIVQGLGRLLEERTSWARSYRILDIIEEFSDSLRNELSYIREGQNNERIAKQFTNNPTVYIPKIYWDLTSEKVLTMELIKGIKVTKCDELDMQGYDRKLIAKRLVDAMLQQIVDHGFFHGDPHAGNVYVLPGNTVAFLDFGMARRISEELNYHFASIIIHLQDGNTDAIIKTFSSMEIMHEETDIKRLKRDLDDLQLKYEETLANKNSLGKIVLEIFTIAYHHKVAIPAEISILSKVILILEGVINRLDPDFSIMKAVEPYAKKLIRRRYHPKKLMGRSIKELMESADILTNLPKDMKEIMSVIKKGKVRLDINVSQLESVMHRLDRISNRLSFSIILLSFSILMAGLIIGAAITGQTTMLWDLPIIEIGTVIAVLLFILMIYTIIKSGRM